MLHSRIPSLAIVAAAAAISLFSTVAFATLVADSVADYSLVQGQAGWYYGYFMPSVDADFRLMTRGGQTWPGADCWVVDEDLYYAMIRKMDMHSNGSTASRSGPPVDIWSSRRYVSEVAGLVSVTGLLAKADPRGGDGIVGHILLDGVEVWSQYIAGTDGTGISFAIELDVDVGSTLDFMVTNNRSPWFDTTRFMSQIWLLQEEVEQGDEPFDAAVIPEPASLSLFALGGIALLLRRRRARER